MQVVRIPPSEGLQIIKDHIYRWYRSHPGDKYLNDKNPVNFLLSATLSFEEYNSLYLLPGTRYTPRHAKASKTRLLLIGFSNKLVARDSVHSEMIFTQKRGASVLHASPFSTCDTPRISQTHIPKGNLVYIYIYLVLFLVSLTVLRCTKTTPYGYTHMRNTRKHQKHLNSSKKYETVAPTLFGEEGRSVLFSYFLMISTIVNWKKPQNENTNILVKMCERTQTHLFLYDANIIAYIYTL